MRNRWSKVLRPGKDDSTVEAYKMVELVPYPAGQDPEGTELEQAELEIEPPHDCTVLQQQAYAEGRRVGLEEGRAEVRTQAEEDMRRASELVGQVGVARLNALRQAETDVVELALAVAKKIIHREVGIDPEVVRTQVQHALELLSTSSLVQVRVHPDDLSQFRAAQEPWSNRDGQPVPVQVVGDPSVARGGCLVDADTRFLDATVDRQLEVIRRGLLESLEDDEPPNASPTS